MSVLPEYVMFYERRSSLMKKAERQHAESVVERIRIRPSSTEPRYFTVVGFILYMLGIE